MCFFRLYEGHGNLTSSWYPYSFAHKSDATPI